MADDSKVVINLATGLESAESGGATPLRRRSARAGERARGRTGAAAFFDSLSYTHRREYAGWISEAKRDETRRRRLERALGLLRAGVETPHDARGEKGS